MNNEAAVKQKNKYTEPVKTEDHCADRHAWSNRLSPDVF